ncbi:MAG: hypothetical protein ABJ382_13165, partial [Ilumatobacter sp.]
MAWTSRSSRSATSKPKVELDDDRPKLKRTWPQRLVIAVLGVAAVGSFGASASAWFVQRQLEDRVIVQLDSLEVDTGNAPDGPTTGDTGDDAAAAADGAPVTAATDDPQPVETFPPAEPGARNIL